MPDLPNVELLQASYPGVGVAPGVMEAPAAAAGNVGKAISRAGERGLSIAHQMAEAQTSGQLAQARADMRQAEADFADYASQQMDQTQWLPEWEKRVGSLSQGLLKAEGLSPDGRQKLEMMLTEWRGSSAARIQNQAMQHGLQRARQGHLNALDAAVNTGDRDAAYAEIQAIPGWTPEAKEELWRQSARRLDWQGLSSEVAVDPQGVLDRLEKGDVPDTVSLYDRERAKSAAERQLKEYQHDEQRMILDRYQKGDIKTLGELEDEVKRSVYLDEKMQKETVDSVQKITPLEPEKVRAFSQELDALAFIQTGALGPRLPEDVYAQRVWDLRRRIGLVSHRPGTETIARRSGAMTPENLHSLDNNRNKPRIEKLTRVAERFIADVDRRMGKHLSDEKAAILRGHLDRRLEEFIDMNGEQILQMPASEADKLLIDKVKEWEHEMTAPDSRAEVFGGGVEPPLPQSSGFAPSTGVLPNLPLPGEL